MSTHVWVVSRPFVAALIVLSASMLSISGAQAGPSVQSYCVVHRDDDSITFGPSSPCYAKAGEPVRIRATGSCTCGCADRLVFDWVLGDGTRQLSVSEEGGSSTIQRTYSLDGTRQVRVLVKCLACGSDNVPAIGCLTVHVISGIMLTRVGNEEPPVNYKICLNNVACVSAQALPAGLPVAASALVDWSLEVGDKTIERTDEATSWMTLDEESDGWPSEYSAWGPGELHCAIGVRSLSAYCELVTGKDHPISTSHPVLKFFERGGHQKGFDIGSPDMSNWFYYYASDNGGPCMYSMRGTTSYAGLTVAWIQDDSIENIAEIVLLGDTARVRLSSRVLGRYAVPFTSPRFPLGQDEYFLDSMGEFRFFAPGTIAFAYDLRSVDACEGTCRHEMGHALVHAHWLWEWWPRGSDPDRDGLSSSFEDGYGTYWNNGNTYEYPGDAHGINSGDQQLYCDDQVDEPQAPTLMDWAYPGKQWVL